MSFKLILNKKIDIFNLYLNKKIKTEKFIKIKYYKNNGNIVFKNLLMYKK